MTGLPGNKIFGQSNLPFQEGTSIAFGRQVDMNVGVVRILSPTHRLPMADDSKHKQYKVRAFPMHIAVYSEISQNW